MEKIEHLGHTITITPDIDPIDPRKDYCQISTMTFWHNRYSLGDEHSWDPEEFKQYLEENEDTIVSLPVYMYEHSGITISTSPFGCRWDSGQIGFIHMSKETIDKEFGGDTKQAILSMEAEVEEYDTYLRGDVYQYDIADETGDIIDSCGGYYGYDYCLSEAKSLVERLAKKKLV